MIFAISRRNLSACRPGRAIYPIVMVLVASSAMAQAQPVTIDPLFGTHAVVQRDVAVRVWGTAAPGETVTVEMAHAFARAVTAADGRWRAQLAPVPAGGPHMLIARGANGEVAWVDDILVGDVYLCSGQSNMVLPVSRTRFGAFEAGRATDARVRMLTIPNTASPVPLTTLPDPVAWEVASPETVAAWSGTCYYFARELRGSALAGEDVPVGLITAAWGGSGIRAWMSGDALASVGGYDDALELLRLYTQDEPAAQQRFGRSWQTWWLATTGGSPNAAPWQPDAGSDWTPAPDGLGDWTRWDDLRGFTGMVWFRATFELSSAQAGQEARLALGAVDEVDQTWLNGRVVANSFGYGTDRTYDVPDGVLGAGRNVLVVNVLNTYATGGLLGDPSVRALILEDGTRIPLADWRYEPVRDVAGGPPRSPWESVGGLSGMHHAIVAPLGDIGLRGVLWYQGESDTGDGAEYAALLRALITQWRAQFQRVDAVDLPAFVVQLPNYGPWPLRPGPSGWAEVRNAQRLATRDDPRAALAVTLDVGDPNDLHPADKQSVGRRLAGAARRIVYADSGVPTGPRPVRAVRRADEVVVDFEGVHDMLIAFGGAGPIGFELCGPGPESCRYAHARVDGTQVRVRMERSDPVTRVRYAWADSPIVTLFDGARLPVGTFELPVQTP